MTNKKKLGLFIFILACFFGISKDSKFISEIKPINNQKVEKLQDRQIIDQKRVSVSRTPASVSFINTPSPAWENKLKNSLQEQAGGLIKEIQIKKERSLVWQRDDNSLFVESVVITVKNEMDVKSSFRALVDSQTGKVLESWDRTIFDPVNVRAGLRIKLDPRYSK